MIPTKNFPQAGRDLAAFDDAHPELTTDEARPDYNRICKENGYIDYITYYHDTLRGPGVFFRNQ